jgi:DNA modification methylase
MEYKDFLENKVVIAERFGFKPIENKAILLPHQNDIVNWCVDGGRRAIFASFGLGKTVMQLSIARQCILFTQKPFLIAMPLGVIGEFKKDNELLNTGFKIQYITDTDSIDNYEPKIYLTNYERIRKGDIDSSKFCGVCFDEASILRNMKTETTNYVLSYFKQIPYRFVATATPTPNDYIEILNYADYLGVIDRGHALTRFFQRDSTKAGNLKLYENKKDEFWKWVSTWAVFINKPSDLGYNDTGYDLPELDFKAIEVLNYKKDVVLNKFGEPILFKDNTKSLVDVSREKAESIDIRCIEAVRIAKELHPNENVIFWHHRESEREMLESLIEKDLRLSVFGSQDNKIKEQYLMDFADGKSKYLLTKPQIAGSGCNFQHHCHIAIFTGIDYKFNDFIQAIHRIHRFKQTKKVLIYVILTQNEHDVLKELKRKWRQHIELQKNMIDIVREYGLNEDKIKSEMKRQMFNNRNEMKVGNSIVINNDTVIETKKLKENSQDLILTSIPFGDHYEYSDNYNCFGHNNGNSEFWKQMDYLTPDLLRVLKPGRIAAIHVKDRIQYSYQNGTSFTTISDFTAETSLHFQRHGFYLMGKITVSTDVVRENNQTYRLGWTEQCKDASKMGVGLPEYILLFRKKPTENNNAYADTPIYKEKTEYTRPMWQIDAHAYWKSSGNRLLTSEELSEKDLKSIVKIWKNHDIENIYNYKKHLELSENLELKGKLSSLFMTLPTHSNNEMIWTDINRMNTLNANQANRKCEKHICPLQLDIIERLINRFSSKDESVFDPFGGLLSTCYVATKLGRKSRSHELNTDYFKDGLFYLKSLEYEMAVPTLFDVEN